MARFTLTNCDFGFKRNGVKYEFTDVNGLTIDDPERNKLTRGANGKNKEGLVYKEGVREPKRWTIPFLNMTAAMKLVLDEMFDNQERADFFAIDRTDGSSKFAKNAILSNRPQQLELTDSADSLQVSLEIETFDSSETHKS